MSIYIQYCPIRYILTDQSVKQRLCIADREKIRSFRLKQLQKIVADIVLDADQYGKPIAQNHTTFAFNHSHSQKYYALAYSQDVQDIGVDIEDFSRHVRMQALARHAFHAEEILSWQATDFDRAFWFKIWTIKEAVLKAHGLGIRLNLKDLNTHAHPTWDFGVVNHPELGQFTYQCVKLPASMLTVAYRQQDISLQSLIFSS